MLPIHTKKKYFGLFLIAVLQAQLVFASTFSDVESTNPYYGPIEAIKTLNIINGYDDGTFKPYQEVSRAEALKMMLAGLNIKPNKGLFATSFPDVPLDSWFAGYVMEGLTREIINGNADGTFAPHRTVNKAEFIKMLLKTYNINPDEYQLPEQIAADVSTKDWFASAMNYAKDKGIIYADFENKLEPSKNINRGESAEIIYKIYLLQNGGEIQKLLSMAEAKLIDGIIQINNNNMALALDDANQALFYTDTALKQSTATTVQAANKISAAFQKLFLAYHAKQQGDEETFAILKAEAMSLAEEAENIDTTIAPLATQIRDLQ